MLVSVLAMSLATSPTILRIDMLDALRLPSGFETPPGTPLVIIIKAPKTWVEHDTLSKAGKEALLARLYGGPDWMNGNDDGSTYVVKSFESKVIDAKALPAGGPAVFWYEVDAKGSLQKRGAAFSEPTPPPPPKSLIDSALPGSVFEKGPTLADGKAALAWLEKHDGLVKLPSTLRRGDVGFDTRGVTAGSLTAAATKDDWQTLERLAGLPEVVAVGEMGLDYFYDHSPRDTQIEGFHRQCQLAKAVKKPVVIHVRDAHDDCVEVLKSEGISSGMIHCFTGDLAAAKRYLELGFFISISGVVTYKKSEALQEAVKFVPLERLMVETDSPYLSPIPHRGKWPNEPRWVVETAKKIAELKGLDADEVALTCARNSCSLLGLPVQL